MMKATILVSVLGLISSVVALPPPIAPEVQELPSINRKDAVIKQIRYGPHILKKAVVRHLNK
jgi:hypothetical protein